VKETKTIDESQLKSFQEAFFEKYKDPAVAFKGDQLRKKIECVKLIGVMLPKAA